MTQTADVARDPASSASPAHLRTALQLAELGLPAMPLREGKKPFGNCRSCKDSACGDRPHMLAAGPCECPAPCHGWAAATTDPHILTSPAWARAWRQAAAVAYHPGGAALTVVDLDNRDAVMWARENMPATKTVTTTRGEHWIYLGTMTSHNGVRPGVDIKSAWSYARWLGPGTGRMALLPDSVRALAVKEVAAVAPAPSNVVAPAPSGDAVCRHRTPTYLERGIAMAEQRIKEASEAIHRTVYRTFLAVLSAHGWCGCLTENHIDRLFTAAQAKGESLRHCEIAWTNARTKLGM
ncbi:bifunctional DNA primase/polymerase [Streptomyces sp. NBC_01214]|uniref:bifunctional DNA primase/polymerase n=1 Tax=Streptomyces sp. NBC_01214 TaxID=2903777 RepID=UPI00224E16A4|nr:bifunctional DNA primase/polymerase [Streptomyces sp. NBC_01214]MCX4801812.1 bifunctional DNA primase/polymerase [Streptomyces sp. NBC_01214]